MNVVFVQKAQKILIKNFVIFSANITNVKNVLQNIYKEEYTMGIEDLLSVWKKDV